MSRNPELFQQIDREDESFPAPVPPAISGNGHRPRFDIDAFRREEEMKLVQRLFILPGPDAPRMVVFCGVESGDASSWVCTRAGETLASQVKTSVCVVNANLRTPSLHEHFQIDNSCGLTDAVLKPGPIRNFAHQLNGGNLWVITSGSRTTDPHTLLTSDRLQSRMTEIRAEFDYVLLDGPPVNLYVDATLLGKMAEGVVLVLQANSTRRETARKARESLESAKVRLWGAVLNKRTFPVPDLLYRNI
jgi:capsular exopolysaccharide synthesis family protein